ncbi:taste receptor type 2 member 40-like [Bombina bombina]|uniref:taste receptor type 2 member 40-like n=1 Tax=Bombina bombina TaxID=8345 RepID=UPI00235B2824|nr:taste receptor type 2 member 40-like [Bombina bombina]
MHSTSQIVTITVISIGAVLGTFSNAFIITVIFHDQNGLLSQSPGNQIQFCMGLCNLLLQCVMAVEGIAKCLPFSWLGSKEFRSVAHILFYTFVTLSFWLTAWLCTFYCVTIVRFNHRVMRSLKLRLPDVVLKLFLVTVLVSFCIGLPSIINVHNKCNQNKTENCMANNNETTNNVFIRDIQYGLTFLALGSSLPLVLALLSIGFTVSSLLTHIRQMKLNVSTVRSHQLEAHYRACRTMTLLIIVYVIFNVSEGIMAFFTIPNHNVINITASFIHLYPAAQAVIVVCGSPKLKNNFSKFFLCIK